MAALEHVAEPGYSAIIFRRTYADLVLPGALMDRARRWLSGTGAKWLDKEKTWRFPSGATLTFGYLDTENDKYRYQGSAYTFVGFDELTQFTESAYLYLFSRLRRLTDSRIPLRMRSTTNPGGIGAQWVSERFIPDGFTPELASEPRVFSKSGADGGTRYFVPARLQDNPYLDQESYRRSLDKLDPVTKEQLLRGDWQIRERGNIFPMWEDGVNGRHVITWSQFAEVYGARDIPTCWLGRHGHDSGFDPDPRAAVWNFVAGANGPLAGDIFCTRELYKNRMTVDDFADALKLAEAPNGETARIQVRVIGHEARRGMPQVVPYGFFNHLMDAQRMVAANWFANIAPFSAEERRELSLPEAIRKAAFDAEQDPYKKEQMYYAREIALKRQSMERIERQSGGRRTNKLAAYRKLMRQGP